MDFAFCSNPVNKPDCNFCPLRNRISETLETNRNVLKIGKW